MCQGVPAPQNALILSSSPFPLAPLPQDLFEAKAHREHLIASDREARTALAERTEALANLELRMRNAAMEQVKVGHIRVLCMCVRCDAHQHVGGHVRCCCDAAQREVDAVSADLDKVLAVLEEERREHEKQIHLLHEGYKQELDQAVLAIRTAERATAVCDF